MYWKVQNYNHNWEIPFYLSDGKLDPFVSVEHKPKKYNTVTSKTTLSAIGGDCSSYLIGDEPNQPSNQSERKIEETSNEGKFVEISKESNQVPL